jgi:hypothetical protein
MKADIELSGYAPDLIVGRDGSQIVIRCQQVAQTTEGPKLNGKIIHLGMTAADAMRLLDHLSEARRRLRPKDLPTSSQETVVPPEKDRH